MMLLGVPNKFYQWNDMTKEFSIVNGDLCMR